MPIELRTWGDSGARKHDAILCFQNTTLSSTKRSNGAPKPQKVDYDNLPTLDDFNMLAVLGRGSFGKVMAFNSSQ